MRAQWGVAVALLWALNGWAAEGEGVPLPAPRLRSFIGGSAAVGEGLSLHLGPVGLAADLGVQLNERIAVAAQLRATSAVVLNQAMAAITFDGCVSQRVCLEVGVGGAVNFGPLAVVSALALPLSVGWQSLWPTSAGRQAGVRLNFELVGLFAPATAGPRFGFSAGVSIGYLRR